VAQAESPLLHCHAKSSTEAQRNWVVALVGISSLNPMAPQQNSVWSG
jgi:hypothetical protein